MSVKSKHGSGGEYNEGWRPGVRLYPSLSTSQPHISRQTQYPPPPEPPQPGPPPEEEAAPAGPARPAWRVVHKRPERGSRKKITAGNSPAPPPAAIEAPAPKPDLPAWAQWRRMLLCAVLFPRLTDCICVIANPLLSPQPQPAGALPTQTINPGLFGMRLHFIFMFISSPFLRSTNTTTSVISPMQHWIQFLGILASIMARRTIWPRMQ